MRTILFLALLFGFCYCKKDSEVKMLKRDIAGTWELERVSGYPFNQALLPPGNGRIIVLKEDGVFERKQHDTLVFRGNYRVRTKKDCYERNTDFIFASINLRLKCDNTNTDSNTFNAVHPFRRNQFKKIESNYLQ